MSEVPKYKLFRYENTINHRHVCLTGKFSWILTQYWSRNWARRRLLHLEVLAAPYYLNKNCVVLLKMRVKYSRLALAQFIHVCLSRQELVKPFLKQYLLCFSNIISYMIFLISATFAFLPYVLVWTKYSCLQIVEEFGSFDKYCWGFVNHKPILSRFRYPRQVPVKTSKADAISKDLVRRGFRSVGPTVVYTFMQVSGMTNDHLISCYRFAECAAATTGAILTNQSEANSSHSNHATEQKMNGTNGLATDLELTRSIDELSIS